MRFKGIEMIQGALQKVAVNGLNLIVLRCSDTFIQVIGICFFYDDTNLECFNL